MTATVRSRVHDQQSCNRTLASPRPAPGHRPAVGPTARPSAVCSPPINNGSLRLRLAALRDWPSSASASPWPTAPSPAARRQGREERRRLRPAQADGRRLRHPRPHSPRPTFRLHPLPAADARPHVEVLKTDQANAMQRPRPCRLSTRPPCPWSPCQDGGGTQRCRHRRRPRLGRRPHSPESVDVQAGRLEANRSHLRPSAGGGVAGTRRTIGARRRGTGERVSPALTK